MVEIILSVTQAEFTPPPLGCCGRGGGGGGGDLKYSKLGVPAQKPALLLID